MKSSLYSLFFFVLFASSVYLSTNTEATYVSSGFHSPGGNFDSWLEQYDSWRCLYVNNTGAGIYAGNQLRVQRRPPVYGDNGQVSATLAYDTLSQGVAYGMLFSAYANDQTTFDGLWNYAQANFLQVTGAENAPNCMQQHILSTGVWVLTSGKTDCSTDADQDMIYALLIANKRWGGSYLASATALASVVLQYEVDAINSLKYGAGTYSGGNWQTIPSYFATGYWKLFASTFSNSRWDSMRTVAFSTISAINIRSGGTGLVPEFATVNGTQPTGTIGSDSANWYSWNGLRLPWRMATDLLWYNTPSAGNQCESLVAHWVANGADSGTIGAGEEYLTGGYTPNNVNTDMAFLSTAMTCSLFSTGAADDFTAAIWGQMSLYEMGDYYKDSMFTLSYLFAIGGFQLPSAVATIPVHTYGQCNLPKYNVAINGYCQVPDGTQTQYAFWIEFDPRATAAGTTTFQYSTSLAGPWVNMVQEIDWGDKWWKASRANEVFPVYIKAEGQYWQCQECTGAENAPCVYLDIEPTLSATPSIGSKTATPTATRTRSKSRTASVSASRTRTRVATPTRSPSKTHTFAVAASSSPSKAGTPSRSRIAASSSTSKSRVATPTSSISRTRPGASSVVPSKSKTRVATPTRSRSRVVAASLSKSASRSRSLSRTRSRLAVSKSLSRSKSRSPSRTRSRSRSSLSRSRSRTPSRTRSRSSPSRSRSRSRAV